MNVVMLLLWLLLLWLLLLLLHIVAVRFRSRSCATMLSFNLSFVLVEHHCLLAIYDSIGIVYLSYWQVLPQVDAPVTSGRKLERA